MVKKLILAFVILVAAVAGGYSLYRFTDIFQKPSDAVEVVENVENEVVLEAEK